MSWGRGAGGRRKVESIVASVGAIVGFGGVCSTRPRGLMTDMTAPERIEWMCSVVVARAVAMKIVIPPHTTASQIEFAHVVSAEWTRSKTRFPSRFRESTSISANSPSTVSFLCETAQTPTLWIICSFG